MKRISNLLVVAVMLATFGAGNLLGQDEKPWSVSIDSSFVNQYVWRGFKLNPSPSVQPALTFGYKGLSISSWSSFGHSSPLGRGQKWDEHDLTIDYTFSLTDKISVSGGWINYHFPALDKEKDGVDSTYTNEIYGSIAFDVLLSPSLTVYGDVDQGKGVYYYFSIGHGFDLPWAGMTFTPSTGFGVNQKLFIDVTTVSNWDIGGALDVPVNDNVTVTAFYTYMTGNKNVNQCGGGPCFGSRNVVGGNLNFAF